MSKELSLNILEIARKVKKLEESGSGSPDSAKKSDIATEFSATTTYTAGCFVYHEGKLYQFNADHAAGAWDPTDVVEANVTDQIVSNKAAIDGLTASDVAYDNTDSGLIATDVQRAVDEVAERVNLYSFGSAVTIPKNTDYICPSDGYFQLYIPNNVQSYAYGYINGNIIISVTTRATSPVLYEGHLYNAIFVRKGATIKFAGGASSEGYFMPLT